MNYMRMNFLKVKNKTKHSRFVYVILAQKTFKTAKKLKAEKNEVSFNLKICN